MGHLLSTKSSLVPLTDRPSRYTVGLFDSDRLREILSILFSEEEAFIAARLPLQEATLEDLVEATGIDEATFREPLESMADMEFPYAGATCYLLMPGLIGFMEFTRYVPSLPFCMMARGDGSASFSYIKRFTSAFSALGRKLAAPTHSVISEMNSSLP